MKRAGLIVGLAAIVLIGLFGYYWSSRDQTGVPEGPQAVLEDTEPKTELVKSPEPVAEAADSTDTQSTAQNQVSALIDQPAQTPSTSKPSVKTRKVAPPSLGGPAAILPSFDVVRVEPSGEAVFAGRATPESRVHLLDGAKDLAEVAANANGEWVIVLRAPLAPGVHEFSLESHLKSGEILLSENVVVLSVPALVAEKTAPPATAPATSTVETASTETAGQASATAVDTVQPLAVLMPRDGTGPSRIIQAPEPVSGILGDRALLLQTVDYDGEGRAIIGGRGEAGSLLLLYLDGRPAGRTVIGPDGRWQVRLDGEVPFGVHTLRVDQVDEAGKVVARVESPFSRANLLATVSGETAVIVQPGNSLWRIARRVYGQGVRYSVIYTANQNQIGDPDLIYPGQIFVVPSRN